MINRIRTVSFCRPFAFSLFALGVTTVLSLNVNGQYAYSRADKATIFKYRERGAAAFQTYDRNTMYKVGLFFESIYKKYTDTSMRAAISYYQASVFAEGELYDNSLKAAFRLGQFFEKGLGVSVDYSKAAVYYLISGGQGKNNLAAVVKKIGLSDTVLHDFYSTSSLSDSLVIRFHPFCLLQHSTTKAALDRLAAYVKGQPGMMVRLSIATTNEFSTAYYEYWKQTVAFKRIGDQVQQYLYERGISLEQFPPIEITVSKTNAWCILTIHLYASEREK